MTSESPRGMISYSHDSDEHRTRVAAFANQLRQDGVSCWIDQFEPYPEQGWPMWMEQQIRDADFVLLVCTQRYRKRFDGEEVPGVGLGVTWESVLIRNALYAGGQQNQKFIPVGFDEDFVKYIPDRLQGDTRHLIQDIELSDPGYQGLFRQLTGQQEVQPAARGKLRQLTALEPRICVDSLRGVREASGLLRNALRSDEGNPPQRYEAAHALRYLGFDLLQPTVSEFIANNEHWMFQGTDRMIRISVEEDFCVQRSSLRRTNQVPFVVWVVDPGLPERDRPIDGQRPVICVEGVDGLQEFLSDRDLFGKGGPLDQFATLRHVLFDEFPQANRRIRNSIAKLLSNRCGEQVVETTAIFGDVDTGNPLPSHEGRAIRDAVSLSRILSESSIAW